MATISKNLQAVRQRIDATARACGRDPGEVRLIAVSKTWPVSHVQAAWQAGQRAFGENYLQESLTKIADLRAWLSGRGPGDNGQAGDVPQWHFIGPIQGNKTAPIAEHFDWVHSVERLRIATRLSAARPPGLPPLQVLLQVNVSGEASKSGAAPEDVPALAQEIARLPNLRLRGLMAIPQPESDPVRQRIPFRALRMQLEALRAAGLDVDQLSMGMSDDLEAAIAEGATMVRIGTAIFGARN